MATLTNMLCHVVGGSRDVWLDLYDIFQIVKFMYIYLQIIPLDIVEVLMSPCFHRILKKKKRYGKFLNLYNLNTLKIFEITKPIYTFKNTI